MQGSAGVHALLAFRIGALMLATLITGGVQNVNAEAITFKSTDDGLSVAGMFFAKLESLHARHMSGKMGKVRMCLTIECKCMIHMCINNPLQTNFLCVCT
jgi:hypothetical protein